MLFKSNRWMILVVLVIIILPLVGCGGSETAAEAEKPSKVEDTGTEFKRVILTDKAVERVGLKTNQLAETEVEGVMHMVVPYSALIYGLHGETWVYTSPSPLTYVREPIDVNYIEGDMVVLLDGPTIGTEIVTIGAAELLGTETGVGK